MTKQYSETLLSILHSIPVKPGRFPKIEEISVKLNLPKYKCSKLLKELNELGMLSRTGNWYNFINPIEVSEEQANDYIDAITEANKHDSIEAEIPWIEESASMTEEDYDTLKKHISDLPKDVGENGEEKIIPLSKLPKAWQKGLDIFSEKKIGDIQVFPVKKQFDSFFFLRYIMLIIGIISASLLIYYISIYAKENLSNVLAYIRSIVIVAFSFTSFQAIIILFRQTKSIIGYIGIILLFIFWLLVVMFSMISTIAGQFTLFSGKQENITISSTEYNDTILREKELVNNRNILLNQINPYLNRLKLELDDKKLANIQYQITAYNKAVQKIDDELKIIRDKKVQLSSGKVVEQNSNFYTWLSGILKMSSSSLQLFLYILPALFLDLIGPISFSMFMFLGRKKEESI